MLLYNFYCFGGLFVVVGFFLFVVVFLHFIEIGCWLVHLLLSWVCPQHL